MPDLDMTSHAMEPVAQFTLNHDDAYSRLALSRVLAASLEAYETRHHGARQEDLTERQAHEEALSSVIATAGRSYAAAALNRAVHVLGLKLGEDLFLALLDTVTALDLAVAEDLDGANGTGEDEDPEIHGLGGDTPA